MTLSYICIHVDIYIYIYEYICILSLKHNLGLTGQTGAEIIFKSRYQSQNAGYGSIDGCFPILHRTLGLNPAQHMDMVAHTCNLGIQKAELT